jgi:ABC-type glycerol-3-phosphate transport system substrate-binding protein
MVAAIIPPKTDLIGANNMKKALTTILIGLMVLSLVSCGTDVDNGNNGEPVPLKTKNIDLAAKGMAYIVNFSVVGDKMYIVGKSTGAHWLDEKSGENPVTKVLTLDLDGNILAELKIEQLINFAAVDSDGFVWSLDYEWFSGDDGDGVVLRRFNESGERVKEFLCRDINADGIADFNNTFVIDDDGNFYIRHYDTEMTENGYIMPYGGGKTAVLNQNGEMLCDIESAPGHKNIGIYKLPDGRIITCENSEQNPWEYGFREIDINSKSLINKTDFNWLSSGSGSTYLFSGGGDCDLIYCDLKDLYGYNLKTGVSERLINWDERELYNFEVYDSLNPPRIVMTGDIVHLVYVEYDNNGVSSATLLELKIADFEQLEQTTKREIKLSALYLDGGTLETIADFNRRSEEYYINAKLYTNEASPTFDDELKQFNMDLLSGALPDFIFLNDNMPIESYINKGLFADIYEFIDDDPDTERTDYLPNILSALERNGELYTCVTSFGVSTVVGKTSDVGKRPGWTWDEFDALLSKKPSGVIPFGYEFSYFTKSHFLDAVVSFNINSFVDFKEAKANFGGDFVNLLKTANGYPNEYDETHPMSFRNGDPLLMRVDFTMFDHFRAYEVIHFGEETTFIGFPTDGGNGSSGIAYNRFAITKKGNEKYGAWEFAKYLLTDCQEKTGNLQLGNGLPIRTASIEALAEAAKRTPDNGEPRTAYDGQSRTLVEIGNNTEEDNRKILELIYSVTDFSGRNRTIVNIVEEEAAYYFAGQKTAEEVAAVIQNRVSLYLAEMG